jgi:5-methylphenazine-1-carboxylate 1-monooxygenase
VFEQSTTIRELGVGINVLPHAVKELAGLGLLDALDRVGVRTSELAYANRFGQEIWRECQDPFHLQAWWAWSGVVG